MAKDKPPPEPEPGPPTHQPLENPDLTQVKEAAAEYLAYLRDPEGTGQKADNYEHDVLEAAMRAFYGQSVWDEINDLKRKADDRFHTK